MEAKNGTVLFFLLLLSIQTSLAQLDTFYEGCGVDKGCLGVPSGCPSAQDCEIVVSYKQGLSADEYAFELMSVEIDSEYVSMGFSEDPFMPLTNAVVCTADAIEANFIQDYIDPIPLTDPTYGIGNPATQVTGDTLFCSFTRPAAMSFPIPPDDIVIMDQDLNSESYFVLLATGELSSDGRPDFHSAYGSTPDPVDLTNVMDGGDSDGEPGDDGDSGDSFYLGCGVTKGCFGTPYGCLDTKDCDIAVTFKGNDAGSYDFGLRGPLNEFVAFGLSDNQVMSNDSVVACTSYTDVDGEQEELSMYYDLPDEKNSVVLEGGNEMLGLSEDYTIIKEGFFFDCYFTRDASVDVPIPGSTDVVTYDLDAMDYYLLLAAGVVNTATGELANHNIRDYSDERIFVGEYGDL